MTRRALCTVFIAFVLSVQATGTGFAQSSPYVAWGTGGSSSGNAAGQSNQLHQSEREQAQAAEIGRYAANNLSSSTCGTCLYYTIQGNNNVISGNSSTLTNTGDVQGNAQFNFD